MNMPELQRRIEVIEAELAALRQQLAGQPKNPRWYRIHAGVLAGDPDAAEAARLGKQYRDKVNSDSLKVPRKKAKKVN